MPSQSDTRSVVQQFLEALASGNSAQLFALFAQHVDWRLSWPDGAHTSVPWIRARSTAAEAVAHFTQLRAHHVPERDATRVHAILVEGCDAVVLSTIAQTVRATGVAYEALCALHLTVQDGLITRYHVYEDSLSVARAFGAER